MFGFGITVAIIGIGVVFSALVFLIFVIKAISVAARVIDNTLVAKKSEPAVSNVEVVQPVAVISEDDNEDEILAIISAAIASLTEDRMVVKTISRLSGYQAPAWSYAGRVETMNLRQI